MSRLLDVLLGTNPSRRMRLSQTGLVAALLLVGVAVVQYFVAVGVARAVPAAWWTALTLAGMAVFFLLIRSGWSHRLAEPALMVPQMAFGLASGAAAYALLGAGRGVVLAATMVMLMFGVFAASPRQMRGLAAFAVLLFGLTMGLCAVMQPQRYPAALELGHFVVLAALVLTVSLLAARLSRLRYRARLQRAELAQALSRLREHTTRDELTGLANRRHMQDVLEQERQRCMRSGQTFCVALLDIDRFKAVNEAHGYAAGDAVLRAVSQEALRHVRVADLLARWSGEEFLLMLPDTRVALARGGLERLHQRVSALRILHGSQAVGITLSAGVAEHHAGEDVAHTLERVHGALLEAKALGSNRIVVAV